MWEETRAPFRPSRDDTWHAANLNGKIICLRDNHPRAIHIYNLNSGIWRKYVMPASRKAPFLHWASVAALGNELFVFGGLTSIGLRLTNALWKLSYDADGRFVWVDLSTENKSEAPSPRYCQKMWTYNRKVWIFGGCAVNPGSEYLNKYSDIEDTESVGNNNQLLEYDVRSGKWTDVKCTGSIPEASEEMEKCVCARFKDTLWLYCTYTMRLFQLDLHSFHWSVLTSYKGPVQVGHYPLKFALTVVDDNRIVLFRGASGASSFREIWVLNVSTKTWTLHSSEPDPSPECVVKDPHSNALFLVCGVEGCEKIQIWPEKQQPKSLKWHALKAVDQQRGRTGLPGIPVQVQHELLLPGEKITELDDGTAE